MRHRMFDPVVWRAIYDRVAPGLALLVLVISLAAGVGTYFNDRAITSSNTKRIADNTANAVTSCENANESRAASRALWNYILDLNSARQPDQGDYVEQFRTWVNQVYAPHDCTDLARKYELPPPPKIPPTP